MNVDRRYLIYIIFFLIYSVFVSGFDLTASEHQTNNKDYSVANPNPSTLVDSGGNHSELNVAQNQGSGMESEPPAPVETEAINSVESINFDVEDGAGIVTIMTSERASYEELPREGNTSRIKLLNVVLPANLQVSRDVSEFDSPLNFVSSFRDPASENNTIIVLELKEDVPMLTDQSNNLLTLRFQKPPELEGEPAREEREIWAFDYRVAATPGAQKEYRGERVSFDFKDADIRDVFRILADISGFNIIIANNVTGTVTLKLSDVPWDQALDVVLEDAGLGAIVEGNVMKIAPLATLQKRQTEILAAARSKEQLEPLETRQVFVNYARAEELVPLVDPLLSPGGSIRVDTRTNSILLTDTVSRVGDVEDLITSLDTRTPQVLIESRIVQATLDFIRELGVQWGLNYRASAATGNPTGATFPSSVDVGGVNVGAPFGTAADNFIIDLPAAVGTAGGGAIGLVLGSLTGSFDLDIRLSALENKGDGRILSSPKVLTLDNQPARIEQGVSIPFLSVSAAGTQTQFVDATLRLEVTPHVTNDNRILMEVRVTDNAPDPTITGANGQPSIRRNEAETQALSSDGETIVIGGIFKRDVSERIAGVPWFSRVPLLGWLFRRETTLDQRRELMVFITPRIVR
ncbi:MAG: type IV pilus secretin PilQ [Thermodesulfobacteriota bacterium]